MSRIIAFSVVGIALLVRLLSMGHAVPFGDGLNYLTIVENMHAGRGMMIDAPPLGTWRALYPPIYPLALWLFSSVFGLSTATVTAFNFICNLGTGAGLIRLARLNDAERAGWWAAAFYLLWPTNIVLAPVAAKEPLIACLVVWMFCFLVQRRAIAFGLLAGLLALTQPALAPLPAVSLLFLNGRLDMITRAVPVAALIMLPWWIRNYLVLGSFVPLTTGSGMGLWMAAIPWGSGGFTEPSPYLLTGGELSNSKAMAADAMHYIVADPVGYVRRCLAKVAIAFSADFWPIRVSGFIDYRFKLVAAVFVLFPALLYGGAAFSTIKAGKPMLTRLMLASLVSIIAFQLWFEFGDRHRYFLTPLLILVVAVAALHKSPAGMRPAGVARDEPDDAAEDEHLAEEPQPAL